MKGNTTRSDDSESEGNARPPRKEQPRKKRKTRDATENANCAGNEEPPKKRRQIVSANVYIHC